MMRPPSLSIARNLVSGAESGVITVAGIPSRCAQYATPCAMFPADAVSNPLASRSGAVFAMAFDAPRILNEPIGCRFSSLR